MRDYLSEAETLQPQLVQDRRWLHQHPEIGFNLDETTDYVRGRLEAMGYTVDEPVKSCLVALAGDPTGPCYLLRADMDALPIREETGLPFASANGTMHACGHDLHTTMLLGAAELLKRHETELPGCVKLLFQPDEEADPTAEVLGGQAVVDAGVLENPHVEAASGLHVCPVGLGSGEVGIYPGTMAYSIDDVDIVVTGRSTHGAQTYKGVDPINVMCHIHLALQEVLAREVDPQESCVLSFGIFEAGTISNTIPGTAHMVGTLRTNDEATRLRLHERVRTIAEHTAQAFGATAEVQYLRGNPTVYNDPALTDELAGYYQAGTGRKAVRMTSPFPGSDDFGIISHEVPSVYFNLGATPDGADPIPLHNSHIVFDEGILPVGAALHASAATGWLEAHAK